MIRAEIVDPLRALRRRLRAHRDSDVQSLRERVKTLELAAEKIGQYRLARFAASGLTAAMILRALARVLRR